MKIAEKLRELTKPKHDKAEALNFTNKIMSSSMTLNEYRLFLLRNYLFNDAIENRYDGFEQDQALSKFNFDARRKSHLALKDLSVLNIKGIPELGEKLQISSVAEMLGALYVSEGSSLGAKVIYKKLQSIPDIDEENAYNFLNSYGNETGMYWKKYVDFLNAYAEIHPDKEDEIKAGAENAYDYFLSISELSFENI